jgi:hypothetical protein
MSDFKLQPKRKRSHARFCAIGNCGRSEDETVLHRFPSDVSVVRKWSEFVNQDRIVPDHSGTRICTYNFDPMSYTDPQTCKRLCKGSVPTIIIPPVTTIIIPPVTTSIINVLQRCLLYSQHYQKDEQNMLSFWPSQSKWMKFAYNTIFTK